MKSNKTGPSVLHLTLHREFFDAIAGGRKKTEYREDKTYWRSRLIGRAYTEIVFRNGYATDAPIMRVECLGVRQEKTGRFAIRLGKILEVRNYSIAPKKKFSVADVSIASLACPVWALILTIETPACAALVAKPARRLWPE